MDKDNILPAIYGNPTKTTPANNQAVLTKTHQLVYFCIATAKSVDRFRTLNLVKAHSRLFLCGFFYVRNLEVVNCATMMDCVGGGLVTSVASPPFSLTNGSTNPPAQTIALRFVPKTIVSNLVKETAIMSNKTVSGIPSSEHAHVPIDHRAHIHKALCKALIPYYGEDTSLIEAQDSILITLIGLCETIKALVVACEADNECQIRPDALSGFIDSILCQIEALKVLNNELWQEINRLKKDQGGLNK